MSEFVKIAKITEIEPGQARVVEVMGKQIAVFNVDGQYCAIDNTCSHRGGPLADGDVSGYEVTCPIHGAKFDLRTGEVLGPPASQAVACYRIRATGADIEVEA